MRKPTPTLTIPMLVRSRLFSELVGTLFTTNQCNSGRSVISNPGTQLTTCTVSKGKTETKICTHT